jgi:hypothetical protein
MVCKVPRASTAGERYVACLNGAYARAYVAVYDYLLKG